MKRVKLTNGSARVENDCPKEVISALNKITHKARLLSKMEIMKSRSKAYKFLDFD